MAHALLAAVNPVLGIYTLIVAVPVAAIFTSSVFMNVSTTAALSVVAGEELAALPLESRVSGLATLVVLVGLFQIAAGLLRLVAIEYRWAENQPIDCRRWRLNWSAGGLR